LQPFAAAGVDDVGIGGRDGDRADRAARLVVEDRRPDAAGVGRFPDAAVVDADVEDVRLAGDADGGDGAAAAEGADVAPAELLEEGRVEVGGGADGEEEDGE